MPPRPPAPRSATVVARLALPAVACALFALPQAGRAQTMATFDELPTGSYVPVPSGYAGHNWYYADYNTHTDFGPLLFSTLPSGALACRSFPNCAYTPGIYAIDVQALTTSAADAFTFSGYFGGGFPGFGGGPAGVFVQGFVGSSTVAAFTSTFAIPTDNSFVLESLTATPVNRLLFTLVDAQGRPNPAGGSYIRLDDVTFGPAGPPPLTTTPEPGTWAMLAAGLVPLGATVRARRRA